MPDEVLIEIATTNSRVIVTENIRDFAKVTTCPVVLVRKSWWPPEALSRRLAAALERWATANPEPGPWPQWLDAEFR